MKISKFLLPIMLVPMLIGCGKGANGSDNSQSSYKPASSWNDGSFTSLSTTPVSEGCQISGSIIEISTGCYLQPNDSYKCAVTPTAYANHAIKISMSNEEVCTYRFEGNSTNSFFIDTKAIGDCIIKIYAAEDDYLLFRQVIKVRRAYSKTEIEDVVFDKYDIWNATGIYGQYTMSFFTISPLSGLLYGRDDYEQTRLNFTLEYVETKKIFDFSFHSFKINVDLENSSTNRTYTELDIATTGDNILFYYDEGLLEMFRPAELYQPFPRG